jgi:LPS-assembly protein
MRRSTPRLTVFWCPVLLAVLFAPGATPRAVAQHLRSPLTDSEEISIDAEQISYDEKTDIVTARGKVVVKRGETELRADEVQFNRSTNEADALGNVILTDPEGDVYADALHLDLDEETGVIERAEVYLHRNHYSLQGATVEKGPGMSFHIENGTFTTCHCGDRAPDWSISGEDLAVAVGGYGTLKSGTFNILDVPVLYIPRAVFPIQTERQSGFLMPDFGFSNRRGFQTLLPYFWAINKSQDVTVAFDLETAARVGFVSEYRYIWGHGQRGIVEASYFNEVFRGEDPGPSFEPFIPRNRWSVVGEHLHTLPDDTQVFADYFLVGDDLFLRDINTYAFEYGRETAIRTLPYTKSRMGLLHEWEDLVAKADGVYYQNLQGSESAVLQKAPAFEMWGQTDVGPYLMGELTSSAVNFERSNGVSGFRLDLEPGITVPLPLGPYAFGAVGASGRETAYFLSETEVSGTRLPGTPAVLPTDQSREIGEIRAGVGTALDRIYSINWLGLEKLKHSIEPAIEYLYVPTVSQVDLPLFDGVDRVNHRNLFTYGVTTRLVGKLAEDVAVEPGTDIKTTDDVVEKYRELARLSLMQSVDPSREIQPLQSGTGGDNFSDVDLAARINPARALSLRFTGSYDTSNNDFSAARVGFFFEDPWTGGAPTERPRLETRTTVGVSYRFITGNQLQEIDSSLVLRLTDWAGFLYASRYDVVTSKFLDNYWGMRFISTCDCWALDIAVEDRTNPQEVEVRAQLTLVGLGSRMPRQHTAYVP